MCAGGHPWSEQPESPPCRNPSTNGMQLPTESASRTEPLGAIRGQKRNKTNSLSSRRGVLTPCSCFLCDDPIPASLSDPITSGSQPDTGGKLLFFSAGFLQWPGHIGATSRQHQGQTGVQTEIRAVNSRWQQIAFHTYWWERPLGFWKLADFENNSSHLWYSADHFARTLGLITQS